MAKIIILEHEGQEYTLEFTRRTVAEMEQSGLHGCRGFMFTTLFHAWFRSFMHSLIRIANRSRTPPNLIR